MRHCRLWLVCGPRAKKIGVWWAEMSTIDWRDRRMKGTFRKRRSSLDLDEINNDWSVEAHHHGVKPLPMNRFPSFAVTRISAMLEVFLTRETEEIQFSEQIFVRVNMNDSLFLCLGDHFPVPREEEASGWTEQIRPRHWISWGAERENWYD